MTHHDATLDAYLDALDEARKSYADALFGRWAEVHPDATLADYAKADEATTALAAQEDPHELHGYGFPWQSCATCRAELLPARPLPGRDAGGLLR